MSIVNTNTSSLSNDDEPFSNLSFKEKYAYISEIWSNAIPTIASLITPFLTTTISLYYLAKYNDEEMTGGYGIGHMFGGAFVLAWTISFNQASNVFISQAFGAREYHECSLFFRRSLVLQGIMFLFQGVLLWYSDKIMLGLGVEPKLAEIGGYYARMSITFLIGTVLFDSMKSFLIAQKSFRPILYIQLTTFALHFLWAKLFIDVLSLGLFGAIICRILEEWVNAGLIYTYIQRSGKFFKTWGTWTADCFKISELWKQFKFSVSIATISYVQWIYFEMQMIIAGNFDARQVVAHVALVNTSAIEFEISLGTGITLLTFIGNSLGEGKLMRAKNYCTASYYLFGTIVVAFNGLLFIFRNQWANFWSTDPLTQDYLLEVVKIMMIGNCLIDPFNNGWSNILKSVGKDKVTIFAALFSLYVVGIPLMMFFAFALNWQVMGLWVTLGICTYVMTGINGYGVYKLDWEQALRYVRANVEKNDDMGDMEMVLL